MLQLWLVLASAALYILAAVWHVYSLTGGAPDSVPNSDAGMFLTTAVILLVHLIAQVAAFAWRKRIEVCIEKLISRTRPELFSHLILAFICCLCLFQSKEQLGVLAQRVIFFIKNRFQYESAGAHADLLLFDF